MMNAVGNTEVGNTEHGDGFGGSGRCAGGPVVGVERFTSAERAATVAAGADGEPSPRQVTLHLDGRVVTVPHRPGTTVLQSARFAGLRAPSSCETGSCATCMARVVEGEVHMRNNEALEPDEVAEGWVLTCQAEPLTASVTVVYE
jgi:3-ketosteroid 9alpha-monooxygenase subunit B